MWKKMKKQNATARQIWLALRDLDPSSIHYDENDARRATYEKEMCAWYESNCTLPKPDLEFSNPSIGFSACSFSINLRIDGHNTTPQQMHNYISCFNERWVHMPGSKTPVTELLESMKHRLHMHSINLHATYTPGTKIIKIYENADINISTRLRYNRCLNDLPPEIIEWCKQYKLSDNGEELIADPAPTAIDDLITIVNDRLMSMGLIVIQTDVSPPYGDKSYIGVGWHVFERKTKLPPADRKHVVAIVKYLKEYKTSTCSRLFSAAFGRILKKGERVPSNLFSPCSSLYCHTLWSVEPASSGQMTGDRQRLRKGTNVYSLRPNWKEELRIMGIDPEDI